MERNGGNGRNGYDGRLPGSFTCNAASMEEIEGKMLRSYKEMGLTYEWRPESSDGNRIRVFLEYPQEIRKALSHDLRLREIFCKDMGIREISLAHRNGCYECI